MSSHPHCRCVYCDGDVAAGRVEKFLLRLRGDVFYALGEGHFDPRPGFPYKVSRAQAPSVGPTHRDRAPGLNAESLDPSPPESIGLTG